MSLLNVDKVDPSTGTTLTLGTSGDTITVPTGAGLTVTDEVKTNKISPATGTAFALGDSGDTFTIPSGATITNAGTATGFGVKWGQIIESSTWTQFETSSTSYVDSGMTITITPTAASSKILLMATTSSIHIATTSAGGQTRGRFYRNVASGGDTAIDSANGFQLAKSRQDGSYNQEVGGTGFMTYLDSPSYTLTDAIVYKVYILISNGSAGRVCSNSRTGRMTAVEIFA
jgi:hypothetical protein